MTRLLGFAAVLATGCALGCVAAAHAQTSTPNTAESVYTALNGRIDGVVSKNDATADLTAKMYNCSKLQKFYSPDTAGADGQGCIGGPATAGGSHYWQAIYASGNGCNGAPAEIREKQRQAIESGGMKASLQVVQNCGSSSTCSEVGTYCGRSNGLLCTQYDNGGPQRYQTMYFVCR